jgi:putative PEP-CTERM system histidine kinase
MDDQANIVLMLYVACTAAYIALGVVVATVERRSSTSVLFLIAISLTALWSLVICMSWPNTSFVLADGADQLRAIAWYGIVLQVYRRTIPRGTLRTRTSWTMGVVAVFTLGVLIGISALTGAAGDTLWLGRIAAHLWISICAMLLIENIWRNADQDRRWHVNLICVALIVTFCYDLVVASDALLSHRVAGTLFAGRAAVAILVSPLLAGFALRNRVTPAAIKVSRAAAFHSATLLVCGIFFLSMAAAGELFRRHGDSWGGVVEIALIIACMLGIGLLLTSGSARSRIRALIVDNFVASRYDYQREWNRCINTLSAADGYTALHERVIRATAEIVDSPAGALFLRDGEECAFIWAGSWNMHAITHHVPRDHALIAQFATVPGTCVLSALQPDECLPGAAAGAWIAVPLHSGDELIGFVVIEHPRAKFTLDREVFALLGTVASMAATFIAEQRMTRALAQARDLSEYGQRFAFVAHDIKNLSSQLSLLLANAETHIQNPEFQQDVLGTVRSSVQKISNLLRRLQESDRTVESAVSTPLDHLTRVIAASPWRADVGLRLDHGDLSGSVAINPAAFDSILTHLVGNAVDASAPGSEVLVRARRERQRIAIDIVDQGSGMTPEFIRDELFRPFRTSKATGTGIGAYQARQLVRNAGGDLVVESEAGVGTTVHVLLPLVVVGGADLAASAP